MGLTKKRVQANGLTHAVIDEGDQAATAIVLLHGFPNNANLWEKQVCKSTNYAVCAEGVALQFQCAACIASLHGLQGTQSTPRIATGLLHFGTDALQIPPLVKAGYRVIAPDLRGGLGGETDSPQEPEAYDIPKCIVKDVAGESLGSKALWRLSFSRCTQQSPSCCTRL